MKIKRGAPARRSTLGSGRTPSVSRPALLDRGLDHRFRQLIQDTFAVAARFQAIREEFGRIAGLSGAQYSLIVAVSHLAGSQAGASVGQLARHLHVSGTYVTAEANKLEDLRLLRRVPNPEDRRSVLLKLTPQGLHLLDELLPAIRQVNDEIYRDLTRADYEALVRLMAGLARSAGEALALAAGIRGVGAGRSP